MTDRALSLPGRAGCETGAWASASRGLGLPELRLPARAGGGWPQSRPTGQPWPGLSHRRPTRPLVVVMVQR